MNYTDCISNDDEIYRTKVLSLYIYFLMFVNTSIIVWFSLDNYIYDNKLRNELHNELHNEPKQSKRKWFFSNNIES